jgi:hypothetical protein
MVEETFKYLLTQGVMGVMLILTIIAMIWGAKKFFAYLDKFMETINKNTEVQSQQTELMKDIKETNIKTLEKIMKL